MSKVSRPRFFTTTNLLFPSFSGRFLIEKDFVSLLGGVQRDNQGRIISAKAAEFKIIGYMNGTAAKLEQINVDSALGEYVKPLFSNPILCLISL